MTSSEGVRAGCSLKALKPDRYATAGVCIVLLAASLSLYGPIIGGWWTNDDPQILKEAVSYAPWQYLFVPGIWQKYNSGLFTPVQILSFALDFSLAGFDPRFFYIHHLAALWSCSVMLYLVLRLWIPDLSAFAGALLFLVGLPIPETALQLMVRHYLEGLFFSLASIWFFATALRLKSGRRAAFSAIFYLLAAASKEVYIPLPLLLFALPEGEWRGRIKILIPSLVLLCAHLLWRGFMLGELVGGLGEVNTIAEYPNAFPVLVRRAQVFLLGTAALSYGLILLGFVIISSALFLRKRGSAFVFAASLVVSLAPVIPIASGSGLSSRHVLVLWALCCGLVAIVLSRTWNFNLPLRVIGVAAATVALLFLLKENRRLWSEDMKIAGVVAAEGRFFLDRAESGDILRNPSAGPPYFEGLNWVRKELHGTGPAAYVYDDVFFCEKPVHGRVWGYSREKGGVAEITDAMATLGKSFCGTVRRDAGLYVKLTYSRPWVSWDIGPYTDGSYSFILEDSTVKYPITKSGKLKVRLKEETAFRIKYDSPEGWTTYSENLVIRAGRHPGVISWARR